MICLHNGNSCVKIIKEYAILYVMLGVGANPLFIYRLLNFGGILMKITTRTEELVNDIILNDDLEIVSVEYLKEGSNWVLRVYLEDIEGNLSIEDCTRISRELSIKLDEEDFIENSYILEVSSPGVERPLKSEADYNRFKGKKVYIKTYAPLDGQKEFTGTLKGLVDNTVKVFLNESEEIIEIPYESIANARLSVEF